MAKSVKERGAEFMEDAMGHLKQARSGTLGWREALAGVARDARKQFYRMKKGGTSPARKHAIDLVKRGMNAYNAKDYTEAEALFRKAAEKDPGYGRAHAYLGNALYRQKRLTDAVTCWHKAIEVEPDSDAADMAREKLQAAGKAADGGGMGPTGHLVRTRG